MDEEEARLVKQADDVQAMLDSEGWAIVKTKLDARILDLQNINNIDSQDAATMLVDLKARKMASDLLYDFLKKDIYGFVAQQQAASKKKPEDTTSFIARQ